MTFSSVTFLALRSGFPDAVTVWQDHGLISAMLILVFGVALGIGMICFLLVVHFMRTGRLSSRHVLRRRDFLPVSHRAPFAIPSRWIAIRSTNLAAVQSALRLHRPYPCSWEQGLNVAIDHRLFIAPPVAGWTLVMGASLPDPADDVDRCFHFLVGLSRKLGHVQFFSFDRALSHHAWVQVEMGQVLRGYAWAGRTLWNEGRPTRAEQDLGMNCIGYGELPCVTSSGQLDGIMFNADKVPLLAGRWSIDPAAIDARRLGETPGIAGELSRRKTV